MNMGKVIEKRLAELEKRDQEWQVVQAKRLAAEQEKIGQFKEAMRQRLKADYKIDFTDAEVADWEVSVNQEYFDFSFVVGDHGTIGVPQWLKIDHIAGTETLNRIQWMGTYEGNVLTSYDFVEALTFAATGRQ